MTLTSEPPSTLLNWLVSSAQAHWIDQGNLPASDSVIVVDAANLGIASALCQSLWSNGTHSTFVSIPSDGKNSDAIRLAIETARQRQAPLVPMAISLKPKLAFAGSSFPLPRAHVVACVEIPFQVPDQPTEIPSAWITAIADLLKRAHGRSADSLATLLRR
jgi:hypothetical protein